MLALIKSGIFIREIPLNGRLDIDDITVMPALAGQSYGEYSLHEIIPAGPVPEGKVIANTSVEFIGGLWAYVHELQDVPVQTPEEIRVQMPDKTPREFRDILTDMGIFPQVVTDKIMEIPFDIERMKAPMHGKS